MGKVWLVGAGPGDPELLTLAAYRVLQCADVVLYDRLVSAEILACVRPGAQFVYLGKEEGEQESVQRRIHSLMAEYARQYETVVRLKGGDPMVFGRGGEEWAFLVDRGIDVEFIPGLSCATAVPGLAGIPLTLRGVSRSFAVITGRTAVGRPILWDQYADVDTLVILMGVRDRSAIAQALIAGGRPPDQPVAFIERGATPFERKVVATLREVAAGQVEVNSPAVFLVGEVVACELRTPPFSRPLRASAAG